MTTTTTTTATARTWRTAFVDEPARLIAAQPAQAGISSLSILLTAVYFAGPLLAVAWLHPWVVFIITGAAALGVEYAFLKGVADRAFVEAHGGNGAWGDVLVYTTGGLLIVGGTTVLLTYAYQLPALKHPAEWLAALLSLAHVAPLAVIGICSAQLHAAAERVALAERAEAARRAKAEEEEAARRRAKLDDLKADVDAEVYAAEQKALARQRVRGAVPASVPNTSVTMPVSAPGRAAAIDRDALREHLRRTLAEHRAANTKPNKAELARQLGIGRTTLYELLKELDADAA